MDKTRYVVDTDMGRRVSTIARCTGLSETTIRRDIRGGRLKPHYYGTSPRNGARMPLMMEAEIIDWLIERSQRPKGLSIATKRWLATLVDLEWLATLSNPEWASAVTADAELKLTQFRINTLNGSTYPALRSTSYDASLL